MNTERKIRKALLTLGSIAIGFCVTGLVRAEIPGPAVIPPAGVWQLDIQLNGHLQRIAVALAGSDEPKTYWYQLYTVTNNTGEDIEFYPQFEIFTDTFKLYPANTTIRRPVFEAIRDRYSKSIPLLEPEELITGKILFGRDNARDSVAVFEQFDPNATKVMIFVAGLSNETIRLDNPTDLDAETGMPKKVLLRKTLMLEYQVVGDKYNPQARALVYRNRDWLMR